MVDMGLGCVAWWEPASATEMKQEISDAMEESDPIEV